MPHRDIVVIGASAGGVEALSRLFQDLPRDFPASTFVVLHTIAGAESRLPQILNRAGPLTAAHPVDGEPIAPGRVYVARPNHHLMIEDGRVRSLIGPRSNGYRPSVNVLFESAARTFGNRVIGVVLSGSLDDGTLGMQAIKDAGGIAIVQDPSEVVFAGMPRSALDNVDVDYCLSASSIATKLGEIVRRELGPEAPATERVRGRTLMRTNDAGPIGENDVSGFSCPECGGILKEERSGDLVWFRCHVGHSLSERALLKSQGDTLEAALWTALRVLEERITLSERVAQQSETRGHSLIANRFREQNREAREKAEIIRRVLLGGGGHPSVTELQQDFREDEPIEPSTERD